MDSAFSKEQFRFIGEVQPALTVPSLFLLVSSRFISALRLLFSSCSLVELNIRRFKIVIPTSCQFGTDSVNQSRRLQSLQKERHFSSTFLSAA